LILIDEWVAYARQLYGIDGLPAGSFDAQFTFAQALAETARAVPGVLLVVSIPASDIEVGGEGGQAALERLKNVVARMESSWRPASADEGFEIVRRRLFEDVPADKAAERDAVVRDFANLYQRRLRRSHPRVARRTTSGGSPPRIPSIPSSSTGSTTSGRRWTSSSERAACCG